MPLLVEIKELLCPGCGVYPPRRSGLMRHSEVSKLTSDIDLHTAVAIESARKIVRFFKRISSRIGMDL